MLVPKVAEDASSPCFSGEGFSPPLQKPRIRATPLLMAEDTFNEGKERAPRRQTGSRSKEGSKEGLLETRALTLKANLAKLDEFAKKAAAAVKKKAKASTQHIRKDTMHTSAILESRHMSGRLVATIEVDAPDETEIPPPPPNKKVGAERKKKVELPVPKEPRIKVLKSWVRNPPKKIKRAGSKRKPIINTSTLALDTPNLRTPSAYHHSPASLSPP